MRVPLQLAAVLMLLAAPAWARAKPTCEQRCDGQTEKCAAACVKAAGQKNAANCKRGCGEAVKECKKGCANKKPRKR